MFKSIFIAFVMMLVGCVSFKNNKVTTLSNYAPGGDKHNAAQKENGETAKCPAKKNKPNCRDCGKKTNQPEKKGHLVSFTRSWGFVTHKLKEVNSPDDYFGVSFSITNPNKFFRFQTLAMMSNTSAAENQVSLSTQGLGTRSSYSGYVDVESIQKKTVFVILPILSAPLVRYDFDLQFGSRLTVDINLELRTGLGYEWRINYKHSESNIDVLGEGLNNVYLPSSISNESYLTQTTTLDLNIEPFHSELNYLVNQYETMFYLSLGGIW